MLVQSHMFFNTHTSDHHPPPSQHELEVYLETIEFALAKNTQLPGESTRRLDKKFLPYLIEMANRKHPTLNAHFCYGPAEFAHCIQEMCSRELSLARFIVGLGDCGTHFAAFDVRVDPAGQASIIGIEPANFQQPGPGLLAAECKRCISREVANAKIICIEAAEQNSPGDCGIFSLAFVKKMDKEQTHLQAIHDALIKGTLNEDYHVNADDNLCIVSQAGHANNLIPASMEKHNQSAAGLQNYIDSQPSCVNFVVNKKGQTLQSRQAEYMSQHTTSKRRIMTYSNSIEHKRRTEIQNAIKQVRAEQRAEHSASQCCTIS